ncbi:hypothetical protein GC175_11390 [bacterium]|nr:hypothetical protein [bacterium]
MHAPSLLIRGCGIIVLLLAALWASPVAAATCTSTTVGNWNAASTWDCGIVPEGDDDVVIVHNVTLTGVASVRHLTISTGATLIGANSIRTLSVFGDWVNNGEFIPNQQIVSFSASGTASATVEQHITGDTTFFRLRTAGGFSTKKFGDSIFTVTEVFAHDAGAMDGGTSTFVFKDDAKIDGNVQYYFHHITIDGIGVTHISASSDIHVAGNFIVNNGKSFVSEPGRQFRFNGDGNDQSIVMNSSAAFSELIVFAGATVVLPDLGGLQPTATGVTNNGVLRQSGSTSLATEFAYIRNGDGTPVYRGIDLAHTSSTLNATVAIAGNQSNCLNPSGYDHRNRCFGVKNNDATPATATVTLYTTEAEDDITDDKFYEYSGSATWTDRGACPAGDGDPCTATAIVIEPGNNYFLIGTNTPPTPVTLTGFTVTHADDANYLAWETATEVNFAGFYVQRRTDEGHFARVGDFLYALGGPVSGASYTWSDTDLDGGLYHYRLEAVDFDQSTEFFEPTRVEETMPNAEFSVYLPFSFK